MIVVWGGKQKLDVIRSYRDIQNTRAAFQGPDGSLLILTNDLLIRFVEDSKEDEQENVLQKYEGSIIEKKAGYWKFRVSDPGEDAPLLIAYELSKEDIVVYAEPDTLQSATFQQIPQNNQGDVNSDGGADIVDALLVAQYYVGLNPAGFNPDAADVNCDGNVDIVDALVIAQYYVGLITQFC